MFWAFTIAVAVHLCLIAYFSLTPVSPSIKKDKTVINVTFEKRIAQKSLINQLGDSENQTTPEISPIKQEIEKKIIEPKLKTTPKVLNVPKAKEKIIETKVKVTQTKQKAENIKKVEHIEKTKQPDLQKITLDLSLPQTANLANNASLNDTNDSKIKNVDDFDGSQKDLAAQYRKRFEEQITKKFTEMDSEKDVNGWVNFEVEISIDGSISNLKITNPMANIKISKYLDPELKKFAEKVIRASAPFEPLPFELGVTALRISRNYNVITKKDDRTQE